MLDAHQGHHQYYGVLGVIVYKVRRLNIDGESVDEVLPSSSIKHPASTMTLGVVASDSKRMPSFWFLKGLKVGTKEYLDMLRKMVSLAVGLRPEPQGQRDTGLVHLPAVLALDHVALHHPLIFHHWTINLGRSGVDGLQRT